MDYLTPTFDWKPAPKTDAQIEADLSAMATDGNPNFFR